MVYCWFSTDDIFYSSLNAYIPLPTQDRRYFTIDAETGERVSSTSGLLPPPPLTSQSSLAKDLDDLGHMMNIDGLDIVSYLQNQTELPQQLPQAHQMYSQPPQGAAGGIAITAVCMALTGFSH